MSVLYQKRRRIFKKKKKKKKRGKVNRRRKAFDSRESESGLFVLSGIFFSLSRVVRGRLVAFFFFFFFVTAAMGFGEREREETKFDFFQKR